MRHIHLDPLGGVAGDMFVAGMSGILPGEKAGAIEAAQRLAGVGCRLVEHTDGTLAGARFEVDEPEGRDHHDHGDHHHHHQGHHHQGRWHVHWRDIRARLAQASLPEAARQHAIGIFSCLAEAEARVHGVSAEEVAFHEVGAADSIADIVASAWLIAALGPATWTTTPLPAGSGQIRTAHGLMPVPAPATALLLEGLLTHDDGIPGERVTPTGAAILRHLGVRDTRRPTGRLLGSGFGFGTRRLPGVSNCLRLLMFEGDASAGSGTEHRELAVICFEIDDQSGEELAAGLDRVRATEGVHDVLQMAGFGKKGRMVVHVQVLARPDRLDDVIDACFHETTTIGLRTQLVQGLALARRFADVQVGGETVRVKLVERPNGVSGKAESDHLLGLSGHVARGRLRRDAERKAEMEGQ